MLWPHRRTLRFVRSGNLAKEEPSARYNGLRNVLFAANVTDVLKQSSTVVRRRRLLRVVLSRVNIERAL